LKELRQITVIGLGLLGGSISLAAIRSLPQVKAAGYSHRPYTRRKAKKFAAGLKIFNDLKASVVSADLVILATPLCTFEDTFREIADALPAGCIVTDVGSTKVLPHKWAETILPKSVFYVGSHPIAGSEQRGVEFARDDLFEQSLCIVTTTNKTDKRAVQVVAKFWTTLGCDVKLMPPKQHDKILASVSHLPHIAAAAMINTEKIDDLKFAGKGFMDTSRIASGPANIWADIFFTNSKNCVAATERFIIELQKLKKAIKSKDKKQIEKLLLQARNKRGAFIEYKLKRKELIT
jgi:prephenate dehydrogenase